MLLFPEDFILVMSLHDQISAFNLVKKKLLSIEIMDNYKRSSLFFLNDVVFVLIWSIWKAQWSIVAVNQILKKTQNSACLIMLPFYASQLRMLSHLHLRYLRQDFVKKKSVRVRNFPCYLGSGGSSAVASLHSPTHFNTQCCLMASARKASITSLPSC